LFLRLSAQILARGRADLASYIDDRQYIDGAYNVGVCERGREGHLSARGIAG
jgi:hypothetical protein